MPTQLVSWSGPTTTPGGSTALENPRVASAQIVTPPTAVSWVHAQAGLGAQGNTGATSKAITPTGISNLVLVAGISDPGISNITISDTRGWTWTEFIPFTSQTSSGSLRCWWARTPDLIANTITITRGTGGTGSFACVLLDEFSGSTATSPFDLKSTAGSATVTATASVTPSADNCLVYECIIDSATGGATGYSTGGVDGVGEVAGYKFLGAGTSGVSQSTSFAGASGASLAGIATFKLVDSGGAPTVNGAADLLAVGTLTTAADVTDVAAAGLTATATLASAGVVTRTAAADLAATATLTAAGTVTRVGSADLAASATLTTTGTVARVGAAPLAATATLSAGAVVTDVAAANLTATASLTASALVTDVAAVALAATATLSAAAVLTRLGAAPLSATATLGTTATLTRLGAANLTALATLAAAGTVTGVGNSAASLTALATLTATGLDTDVAAAILTATATLTATGVLTRLGSANLTATANLGAAGTRQLEATGALIALATLTAIPATGATLRAVAVLTADGQVVVITHGAVAVIHAALGRAPAPAHLRPRPTTARINRSSLRGRTGRG